MKLKDYLQFEGSTRMLAIRVPVRLIEAAKKKAKAEKVTMTQVIIASLKRFLLE